MTSPASLPNEAKLAGEGPPESPHKRLAVFLAARTTDRLFVHPIRHPSDPTGFCFCEHSLIKALPLYFRAVLLGLVTHCPFNGPKAWLLRRMGARIGSNVCISPGVWIDPTFPRLITIEDNVFIGTGVKITTHEYRMNEFRAGQVTLREGALIGGFAIIGCGIEIGRYATVAAGAVVGRDVPPGATVVGNPARIIPVTKTEQPVGSKP